MSLRVCIILHKNILDVNGDGTFKGLFAPVFYEQYTSTRSAFPNMSASYMKTGYGGYVGCLRRLQNNESDVMATTMAFPIVESGLRQGTVSQTFATAILSAYNNSVTQSTTSVMDAFDALTPPVWSLTAFTAALITVAVMVSFRFQEIASDTDSASRLNGRRKKRLTKWQKCKRSMSDAIDVSMGNIFKQHTAYSDRSGSLSAKATLLLFAVFTFMIHYYFSSMIKTDMVAMKRPETMSSYEEIVAKPEVRPLWLTNRSDHLPFKQAAPDSAAGQLWKRGQRLGVAKCFVKVEQVLQQEVQSITNQKAVLFLLSYLVKPLITNACAASRADGEYLDVSAWSRVDDNAAETIVGPVFSTETSPQLVKKYNQLEQGQFEHHLRDAAFKKLEFTLVKVGVGSQAVSDCVANIIVYPDPAITVPGMLHYERLYLIAAFCLIFSTFILFLELLWKLSVSYANQTI